MSDTRYVTHGDLDQIHAELKAADRLAELVAALYRSGNRGLSIQETDSLILLAGTYRTLRDEVAKEKENTP